MSKQAIHKYYNKLDQYKRFGGTRNESSIRRAFANLLEEYCLPKNLLLVDEVKLKTSRKRPDGTVKDALQLDWGHWESKDVKDDLDGEIERKLEIGYPKFNIIFENSEEIVLIQRGSEVLRRKMADADALHLVLTEFVNYERPEVKDFREAIEKFREDIPDIVEALRSMIAGQLRANPKFRRANADFRKLCKESINPDISEFDIREMLIQHILTAEIFNTVFGESHFHRENSIAMELEAVVGTFFTGTLRRKMLAGIDSYYRAIKAEAARIDNHHEKQKFLKVIYENFYKAYNPKGADRLGIVYTPGEIVRFMVESTDHLLEKHFGKSLGDKNVEILDPGTGTGTFITDIIEYLPPQYLEYKYKNEIHANEVAILPYYIANLNIEYTYQQKMGTYETFENIVFVDTLDNLGFEFRGKQGTLAGFGLSAENLARIRKQNERKISVIIGNPPYNAKQQLYNDFNPNKKYKKVDERIKETYIKHGTAQNQIVVYDMYTRFFRWASDRIDGNGIIAFVSNSSFADAKTYDGFRKVLENEFNEIHIINLKGNARTSGERRRQEGGNVFDDKIRVGIAVYFIVKKKGAKGFKVFYNEIGDYVKSREKRAYLAENKLQHMTFERITPDKRSNWLDITDNDFEEFIPIIDKSVKAGKREEAVFQLFANGLETGRDDWLYDFSNDNLQKKISFYIVAYNKSVKKNIQDMSIKWNRDLANLFDRKVKVIQSDALLIKSHFRPFTNKWYYADYQLNYLLTKNHYEIFGTNLKDKNVVIALSGTSFNQPYHCLSIKNLSERHFVEKSQCLPLYRYESDGSRVDNITDWGLKQFTGHYKNKRITKEDIFHYTYGVLHNPAYREKYEINLKREFPRLPFYKDFRKWVRWGNALMELHIGYESAKPCNLKIRETAHKEKPKPMLRAVPEKGEIILDENTAMTGIPAKAWEYRLGNRSALHWILDQHREKKPGDKTIAEKFNTYKFSDYKEKVTDLLKRVCTVSVKTVDIVNKMAEEEAHE